MFVSFALCTVFAVISVFATCCVNSASSSRIILTPFQKIPNVLPLLHPTVQHKWNGMTLQTSLLHRRAGKHSPHTTAESHNTNACWCMQLVDAVPEIYDTSNAHAINTKSFVCISVEIPNGTAEANGKQMHQVIGLYPTRTLSVYIGRYMQRKHKQMDRANNRARERNWKPNFLFQSSRYGSAKFDSVTLNAQADLSHRQKNIQFIAIRNAWKHVPSVSLPLTHTHRPNSIWPPFRYYFSFGIVVCVSTVHLYIPPSAH